MRPMDHIKGLKSIHWVALGMFLTGLAGQLSAMHSWHEMASPQSVGGIVLNLGGILLALFSEKPSNGVKQ